MQNREKEKKLSEKKKIKLVLDLGPQLADISLSMYHKVKKTNGRWR